MTAEAVNSIGETGRVEALKEAAVEQLDAAAEQVKGIVSGDPASNDCYANAITAVSDALTLIYAIRKET